MHAVHSLFNRIAVRIHLPLTPIWQGRPLSPHLRTGPGQDCPSANRLGDQARIFYQIFSCDCKVHGKIFVTQGAIFPWRTIHSPFQSPDYAIFSHREGQ